MRKLKNSIFYISIIGGFTVLIYWILLYGIKLQKGREIIVPNTGKNQWNEFLESVLANLNHPLAILLMQIVTIIIVARFFGWICKKLGQPSVIGEIIAGIVLGPSLLGTFFPELSTLFFPPQSMSNLQFLSQIGLILFMFVIGMELDLKVLKNQAHEAVVISHASIIFPFALGVSLAYFIYETFAPAGVQFTSFALFIGIAMSITAFPVLARIVQERGLHKTKLGTIVITCAAADDITAWCLLAAVIAIVKAGSFVSALYVIALSIIYVLLMIKIVRPFLGKIGNLYNSKEKLSKPIVAIFFLTLIISAYTTEIIGIHALFGAFMAGAIMPDNIKFRNIFIEKVEDVALVLLLPLFFVFTGLRTQIGLLNDIYLWKITGLIILVAVVGKFVGSAVAAKFVGQNWKDSLSIGALMNTRGLMELVVLNIGYDLGVLNPEIFAMMVIMALVTTIMTGPALDIINWLFKKKEQEKPKKAALFNRFKILISFGDPESGKPLLRLAHSFIKKLNGQYAVTAMHLSQTNELHHFNIEQDEKDSFAPILKESGKIQQKIETIYKASNDIDAEIIEVANKGDYDLLLIGAGDSIYEGSWLGKILGFTSRIINPENLINQVTGKESLFETSPFGDSTRQIMNKTRLPVGVFIEKNFTTAEKVFIPFLSETDIFLKEFAQKLIKNSDAQIIFIDIHHIINSNNDVIEKLKELNANLPGHVSIVNKTFINKEFLKTQQLMLLSVDGWKKLLEMNVEWLQDIPSVLIIKENNQ